MTKEEAHKIAKDFVETNAQHFLKRNEVREHDYARFNRQGLPDIVFSSSQVVQVALGELLENLLTSE
jgi:NCAIR mutase (PurE)-related protein